MPKVVINYGTEDMGSLNHLHCEDCNKNLEHNEPKWIVPIEGTVRKLVCAACKEKLDVVK